MALTHLDCTLRDGGYYTNWDFSRELVERYLESLRFTSVTAVELGYRSMVNSGYRGPYGFTTEKFLSTLSLPQELDVGVMVNASELLAADDMNVLLSRLFPAISFETAIKFVRIACHPHELRKALPAVNWLRERGFRVGVNVMQISTCNEEVVRDLALEAAQFEFEVLYIADSTGSLNPQSTRKVVDIIRESWSGEVGIHAHDNMGCALTNTLSALDAGASWIDSTVFGMGRGPGNCRTEELVIEVSHRSGKNANIAKLISLGESLFAPMQAKYKWGKNPYYYLTGAYQIHPTYVQEMISDSRYSPNDVLAVIEYLKQSAGNRYNLTILETAKKFYRDTPAGTWNPSTLFNAREVLILGPGSGLQQHADAVVQYIKSRYPIVVALNNQKSLPDEFIDVRVACHPLRLLADSDSLSRSPQPLIVPGSMLPEDTIAALSGVEVLDFGLHITTGNFEFHEHYASLPSALVIAYALGVVTSGGCARIYLAGFDGYGRGDPRTDEVQDAFDAYSKSRSSVELVAITPTCYSISSKSVYLL